MQYWIKYVALGTALGWSAVTVDAAILRWFRGKDVSSLSPLITGYAWALYFAL